VLRHQAPLLVRLLLGWGWLAAGHLRRACCKCRLLVVVLQQQLQGRGVA
jgi:hypothetical protein